MEEVILCDLQQNIEKYSIIIYLFKPFFPLIKANAETKGSELSSLVLYWQMTPKCFVVYILKPDLFSM